MYIFDSDGAIGSSVVDVNTPKRADDHSGLSLLKGPALSFPAKAPKTLAKALINAAATNRAVIIIDDRGQERAVPYRQLKLQALQVLASLQQLGAEPGQHVILQLDALEEFLTCFWACVLGGLVPVPVLPFRNANTDDSSFHKLQTISSQLNKPVVLMSDHNAKLISGADEALLPGAQISTYGEISDNEDEGIVYTSKTNDIAFLQYTSGSTSFPKGTQITHSNVIATVQAMIQSLGVHKDSVMLNWMPYYHDMGIIAGHIMAVVAGCKVVAMKPFTFVRRPLMWLQKIDEHKATITFSPNFGLKRILDKARPSDLTHLDLSSLEVILNGAEPISIQTCHKFIDFLHTHCAMPKDCLIAGYGLAEASLAVAIAPRGEMMRTHVLNREKLGCGDAVEHIHAEDASATLFADEGPAVAGMDIRIVDDEDKLLQVGTVGHVQIRGKSVTGGYFDNDTANQDVFCEKWLRTGDLGFMYENRFIITGRVKDVVFVNGQNYYSHDFEHACENIEGLDRLVVIGHFDAERNEEDILAFVACNSKYIGAREKTNILRSMQMRINQCFDVTPTMFVLLKSTGEIPKTTSGKIMRHKLLDNYIEGQFANQCIHISELLEIAPDLSSEKDAGKHVTIAEFKLLIRNWWSQVLGITENAIGDHDPFYSLGGTSIKAIEVLALAEETVDCVITHDMFKEHDTIEGLANFIVRENVTVRCRSNSLVKLAPYREDLRKFDTVADQVSLDAAVDGDGHVACDIAPAIREDDIAIIGMGCVFPQADSVDEFWEVLKEGRDCVTEFPNDRGNMNEIYQEGVDVEKDIFADTFDKSVSKWGSFIETHHFDPEYFNMSELEAQVMDPHQRVFLNAAVQAVQDSGLTDINGSKMGVFVGASGTGFYQQREDSLITPSTLTGALANLAAARVSNAFNLKGPSLSVDTACSSSLVSVDLAVKSILRGESETAIAGGVQIVECMTIYLMFSRAGILSPEGRCFAFSNQANGFVPGEGAGAVVLKRYSDAVRDGDRVYAVIKASASNNDGASLGIMAPNPEGQEEIIRTALDECDVDPSEIGYVEAHGTGTNLGDLIEVRSLSLAFNEKSDLPKQACPIGSIKTNMGHQLAAAGISGLMKTALSVYHAEIPASLHCAKEDERKELKLETTPFYVNRTLSPWPEGKRERRVAAVNSFGFGGTNAHVIVSNAYHKDIRYQGAVADDEPQVFAMSTKSDPVLDVVKRDFVDFVGAAKPGELVTKDVAYSYAARRDHFKQNRVAVVARSLDDAASLMRGDKVKEGFIIEKRSMPPTRKRTAWMFSGQGSQHPAMGKLLYRNEPAFREIVNRCDDIATPEMGVSLRELLLSSTSIEEVSDTAVTQPLVFTMDYALAMLWQSWGVKPDFMLGHSIGEYVAASVADVMSLESALKLVVKRGALMAGMPSGCGMTAVLQATDELLSHVEMLDLPLDVAAYNGPMSTVLSGELDVLAELHARLDEKKIAYQPLAVSHAFHSRHMDPMLDAFRKEVSALDMSAPSIKYAANVTGEMMVVDEADEAFWPNYWADHIRQPVNFHKSVQTLVSGGAKLFLEVGAQEHLSGLTRRIVDTNKTAIVTSTPKASTDTDGEMHMATALAKIYASGCDIDWTTYFSRHGDRRLQQVNVSLDRRSDIHASISRVKHADIPVYPLQQRSMYRNVGIQTYPFKHLFEKMSDKHYRYVPDETCVLFADHVVSQMPMLSGAGQCDLMCHLFNRTASLAPKTLRNVSFQQPWLSSSKLEVEFGEGAEKEFNVTNPIGNTVLHGYVSGLTSGLLPEAIDIDALKQRLPVSFERSALYDIFDSIGVAYGTYHRNITEMHATASESLARLVDARGDSDVDTHGYYLHGGILDAAFQAAAGILMVQASESGSDVALPLMVPLGIETIHLYKHLHDGEYYSHVTVDDGENVVGSEVIACNVSIYDSKGVPVVRVDKLQMKRLPDSMQAAPVRTPVQKPAMPAEFFHTHWRHISDIDPASAEVAGSHWLVFGSPAQAESALSEPFSDRGINSILLPYAHYRDASIDDLIELFGRIEDVSGVLFLGDYDTDATEAEQDDVADMLTMKRLFNALKAISMTSRKNKNFKRMRFIRATRGAGQAEATAEFDIRKSLSTGFLRSARVEFPLLDIRQLDLGDCDTGQTIGSFLVEMSANDAVADEAPETLYHKGQRLSLMFEPAVLKQTHERADVFNDSKTFWVIGGTSGVGRLLSQHLATNYQSNLVLSGSRSLPESEEYDAYLAEHDADDAVASTIRHIRELEATGSKVLYVRTDVRSADSMRVSLDVIRQQMPSLDGIYFSALQLDDMMIMQKDWSGYRNMMDMRVYGLRELIRQTEQDALDFFVMFSSCTGLTGNIGQSDYSASDVFMDAVPFEKRDAANTCRYKSIQWGPWSLGQQVSEVILDHLKRNNMLHVEPDAGMKALEDLLLSDEQSVAFFPGSTDAATLAQNLHNLRQGAGSRSTAKKAKISTTQPQAVAAESATTVDKVQHNGDAVMSNPQSNTGGELNGSQMQMLMVEFERQREMFMKLCENQNALLSGSIDPAAVSAPMPQAPAPVTTPMAVVESQPAPVSPPPVAATPAEAPAVVEAMQQTAAPAPVAAPVEPAPVQEAPAAAPQGRPDNLFDYVASLMAKTLEVDAGDIDPDQNIMELGADSMTAMSLVKEVETMYDIELPATLLFEYSTLNELVEYLQTEIE